MIYQRAPLLIVVAVVLFIVAFLISVGVIDGNGSAFVTSGLAAFAAGHLP